MLTLGQADTIGRLEVGLEAFVLLLLRDEIWLELGWAFRHRTAVQAA